MLAICAITNMETISPFTDSSINKVMLQTNKDSSIASWIQKHSLTSYGRRTAAWQANLVIDWLLGATDQDGRNLSTFFNHSNTYFVGLIFPGSAKTDIGWGADLNNHLIASSVRNMFAKNYWNLIIMLQVTVNNIGDVFSRTFFSRFFAYFDAYFAWFSFPR